MGLPCLENIPDELKNADRWCWWKDVGAGEGKRSKVPCNQDGIAVDVAKDPHPVSFIAAVDGLCHNGNHGLAGIGFILGDGYAGVDIDDCIVDGALSPEAQEIVDLLDSYCEISPSGHGIKLFLKGGLPGENRTGKIEMYGAARYFTVTGNILPDS